MKNYPLLRCPGGVGLYPGGVGLSLVIGVCLVACSNTNTLFEELPADDAAGEPTVEPLPLQPPASAAPLDAAEMAGAGELTDVDLPLAGNLTPPVSPANPALPADSEPCDSEPCDPEPGPTDAAPVIVAVTPADGESGVANDANIVLRFSQPMNREATEAAYQSESIPSSSVSFLWNEDDTELTIVPQAVLEYDAGSDPELVEARRLSFFVSASAADADGRRLSQPHEFSFSLLRQISFTLFAVQNRDLSGSYRSNDTYGGGQCARAQVNMCVGDVRVAGENEQYKGFISFELGELGELPELMQGLTATLTLEITGTAGNPFDGLGGLVLEHASFDAIGAEAFAAEALDELGLIAEQGGAGSIVSAEVGAAFIADGLSRSMTQYRLSFQETTDDDNASDAIISAWDTQTLDVSYLLP